VYPWTVHIARRFAGKPKTSAWFGVVSGSQPDAHRDAEYRCPGCTSSAVRAARESSWKPPSAASQNR